jgi:hypothetical protein
MLSRLQPHTLALGLAVLVTASTVGALGAKANREYRSAAYAHELLAQIELTPSSSQQVVITGHRLQQITITGRRIQQVVITGQRRG